MQGTFLTQVSYFSTKYIQTMQESKGINTIFLKYYNDNDTIEWPSFIFHE